MEAHSSDSEELPSPVVSAEVGEAEDDLEIVEDALVVQETQTEVSQPCLTNPTVWNAWV